MPNAFPQPDWPIGASKMARRIHAHDWAATPLGPIADWPQPLRTAVELMLASPMLAALAVGPERVLLYNDAAAGRHGPRHPGVFGQPLARASEEELHDRAFAGESLHVPTWPLDPPGPGAAEPVEACLIPVRDAGGDVIAVLMTGFAAGAPPRAEAAPPGSGPRLTRILENEAVAVLVLAHDGVLVDANDGFLRLTGHGREDIAARRLTWRDMIPPEHHAAGQARMAALSRAGRIGPCETEYLRRDGSRSWVLSAGHDPGDGTIVAFAVDIGARKQAEAALTRSEAWQAFLVELGDALRPLADPIAIVAEACRLLGERLDVDRAYYVEVDEAAGTARVEHDHVRGAAPSLVGTYPVSAFSWSVDILRRGECHVVDDARLSPVVPDADRAASVALGIVACMGAPLIKGQGLVGALCVTCARPRSWSEAETALLREVAERIWAAIERARAEARLRESEARLAATFESLPVGIGVIAADGSVVLSNSALSRYLPSGFIPSRSAAELTRWRAWHPDGRPLETAGFPGARALRGERVVPGVNMLHRGDDGRETWMSVTAVPVRDGEGGITGVVTVIADVDAVRRAAEALRESEERFRGFAENSTDTIWIADARGERLEYLSPAFEGMFGEPRAAVLADIGRWRDLVHPDDRAMAAGLMPRAVAGETAIGHYRVVRPSDGRVVHLRDTGFPIRDGAGAVRQIAGIVQDVSDMIAVHEALEAEKERFRTLAEGIPQLVWRSGDEGHWSWASPQWCAYTGQTQEESHGLGWLAAIHPDDRDRTMRAWHAARSQGRLEAEYRVRRGPDRTWRWHQARARPMRGQPGGGNGAGHVLEWLGATTDIEELKRYQAEQAVLLAELQHRTRNLVTVIRSIARRSFGASPERDTYDSRLAAIGRVQGFLARGGSWSVPLRDLLQAELEAAGNGHPDRTTTEGPAVELPGDKAQTMALVLHELATNAAKYGALSQDKARLRVAWHVEGNGGTEDRLVLEWRESGVAMPAEAPTRRGYGSELIERALPYQLRAGTHRVFTPDGLVCTITLPFDAFRIRGGWP